MNNKLGAWNTLSLGMMVFCFFLGAGNLIFPPMAGMLAGDNLELSLLGFLATAVGMPLLGLLAMAKVGGGMLELGRYLPAKVANGIALAVYLVLVPMFGIPRTCLVAYELGLLPFIDDPSQLTVFGYTLFYFGLAMIFILRPGKLMDSVGKLLTPALAICIAVLGVQVVMTPFAEVAAPQAGYQSMPFGQGFIDGYQTMDALAALMFGVLMVDALRSKGVTEAKARFSYMVKASLVAALGLTLFYLALFYLGSTATGVVAQPENGGEIIVAYVAVLFGSKGQWLLTAIVTLACFSTAIGGISSFSSYISKSGKLSYAKAAWLTAIACFMVANIGLAQLLKISIPILVAIYPVAIALILFNLSVVLFKRPHFAAQLIIGVAALFGLLDGLAAAGVNMSAFNILPGFEQGFAWLLPTGAAFLVSVFMAPSAESRSEVEAA